MSDIKKTKLKGIIVFLTTLMMLIAYVIVIMTDYYYKIYLHSLYDISTGVGISVMTGVSFTMISKKFYRTAALVCCVFYGSSAVILTINLLNIFTTISTKYAIFASIIILLTYIAHGTILHNKCNNSI